jgi:CO dehydrogenase/acetyl-CoA synthase beta subunit
MLEKKEVDEEEEEEEEEEEKERARMREINTIDNRIKVKRAIKCSHGSSSFLISVNFPHYEISKSSQVLRRVFTCTCLRIRVWTLSVDCHRG